MHYTHYTHNSLLPVLKCRLKVSFPSKSIRRDNRLVYTTSHSSVDLASQNVIAYGKPCEGVHQHGVENHGHTHTHTQCPSNMKYTGRVSSTKGTYNNMDYHGYWHIILTMNTLAVASLQADGMVSTLGTAAINTCSCPSDITGTQRDTLAEDSIAKLRGDISRSVLILQTVEVGVTLSCDQKNHLAVKGNTITTNNYQSPSKIYD